MKLSFNKQPVYENNQLNLFKTDFKRNDLVLWNGIAYDYESNSFIRKLFGVDYGYVAGTGLVHVGKKTIKVYHLSTITGYLVFAPVEAIQSASTVVIHDIADIKQGDSIAVVTEFIRLGVVDCIETELTSDKNDMFYFLYGKSGRYIGGVLNSELKNHDIIYKFIG